VALPTAAHGALPADGETEAPADTPAASCPSPNPPNELALTAGTPQSAVLGSAFATTLQVSLANSDGCPLTTAVAGIPITFTAPSTGASGTFAASDANTVTVGSDASGMAGAPPFTADYTAGGYTVTASSTYGSVSFSLTNVAASNASACATGAQSSLAAATPPAGAPTKLTAGVGASQATPTGTRFPIRLAVSVTDADRHPVPGVLVTFAAPHRGPSGAFTVRSGGARVPGAAPASIPPVRHQRRVAVRTDACGVALAPAFTANRHSGGYVVVASVGGVRAAFALVNERR